MHLSVASYLVPKDRLGVSATAIGLLRPYGGVFGRLVLRRRGKWGEELEGRRGFVWRQAALEELYVSDFSLLLELGILFVNGAGH